MSILYEYTIIYKKTTHCMEKSLNYLYNELKKVIYDFSVNFIFLKANKNVNLKK